MANPFPFTAGQVLTAAQMNGIGEAGTTFTPTWTNYTRGNGTTVAYYVRVNKLVYVYIEETLGATSSMGTNPTLTLPITSARTQAIAPSRCRIDDTGTQVFWGTTVPGSSSTVFVYADNSAGTYTSFAGISATVPMTWAATDKFAIAFVYEAA